jgi:3-oxoacyl-[acyl-carrier protein] reductase
MELGLAGKRAIITGASRGIGRACALGLAKEGVEVCIVSRTKTDLEQVVSEIEAIGVCGYAVTEDLATAEGCRQVVQEAVRFLGGVDILINNVGSAQNSDILDLAREQIESALRLKSFSYLKMAQEVIPHMKLNRWGRIINIAGAAGTSPTRHNIPTGSANILILNMTRALSDAVAKDGILVNSICPGLTNTNRARTQQRAKAKKEGKNVEDLLLQLAGQLPAGRMAEPEEIANAAVFLASSACSYVFGSSIYMDGGQRRGTP